MEINIKEKEQLLEKAIKQIEKEFGKGAIMLLSDSSILAILKLLVQEVYY